MNHRYAMYEGKPGLLVTNPWAPEQSRRYAGQKRKVVEYSDTPIEMADLYDPTPEVLAENGHLKKAVAKGDLSQHGKAVLAPDAEVAAKQLNAPGPAKARPRKDAD